MSRQPQHQEQEYYEDEDPELQEAQQQWATSAFANKSRRMAFVRKVLGTVGLQLAVCAIITTACIYSGKAGKEWMAKYVWIAFIALIFWLIINIAVCCCRVGRGPPSFFNISILVLGTICLSIACAFITVGYEESIVLYALLTTVAIVLVVVLITLLTPLDITGCGIFLFVGMLALVLCSLVAGLVFGLNPTYSSNTRKIVALVISLLFVVFLSLYILYDLQIILGGRRYELDENDWLFACLILFGDIVMLFLQLLGVYKITS